MKHPKYITLTIDKFKLEQTYGANAQRTFSRIYLVF